VQAVPVEKKKLGEAVLTEYFLGTAAGVAASSSTVIQAMCLSCGFQWFPGTKAEQRLRALSGQLGEDAKRKVEAEDVRERQGRERLTKDAARDYRRIMLILLALVVAGVAWFLLTHR
jgi:hypothetical protein